MRIDGVAQVGGDAFTEPRHHVEAQRGEQPQRRPHAEQRQEVFAQRHHPLARVGSDKTLVDQRTQRQRYHQCAQRRQQQEQRRQCDAAAVGPQEGQQPGKGTHRRAAGRIGSGGRRIR
jgi:hypothetical protein